MPSDYYIGYYFFASEGRFKPCGMFTKSHIIALLVCISLIILSISITRNKMNDISVLHFTKSLAVILTVLEAIKISHSFLNGNIRLDAWFPLSFCGLFILSLYMSGFGKSWIKDMGDVYISFGAPIAGLTFLISPSTSLMSFPVWHYFSLYSLVYHSLMIYTGIIYLKNGFKLNKKSYSDYFKFFAVFSAFAIILNTVFGSNLMILRTPYNIPVGFIQLIYIESPGVYTFFAIFVYLILPFITHIILLLKNRICSTYSHKKLAA